MVKSIDKSREREYYSIHIISERNEYIMELPKPNNTHSSEAAKRMEFAEGSDPELTTEEKYGRQRNLVIWFYRRFLDSREMR